MSVEFRCSHCGKLVSADVAAGESTSCPHCHQELAVPEGLASLPQPQVPGGPIPAEPASAPQPPQQPDPADPDALAEAEDQAVMGAMASVMPWVISLFFHMGIALIMTFVVMIAYAKNVTREVVIPGEYMIDNPVSNVNPGKTNPDLKSSQPNPTETKQWSRQESDSSVDTGETSDKLEIIGRGPGGSTGGLLATQGTTAGGMGLPASFLGSRGNAHHIVYVIDRSGSMLETFDYVKLEMLKSIGRLRKVQDYHVILFSSGPPVESPARRLVSGTRNNKIQTAEFLEPVQAKGATNPLPALKRAFTVLRQANRSRKGKLIYLLTDANFPNNQAVIDLIREENTSKDVSVFTYLYGYSPDPEFIKVMEKIANENNGKFKYVSPDE